MTPTFFTVEEVLAIHEAQIFLFGGAEGVRDLALVESAVAQAEATWGGRFLHEDLFAMAGAYLYHLCANHPFVDGNKRAALAVALLFLDTNGIAATGATEEAYALTMAVAEGTSSKEQVIATLRRLYAPRDAEPAKTGSPSADDPPIDD